MRGVLRVRRLTAGHGSVLRRILRRLNRLRNSPFKMGIGRQQVVPHRDTRRVAQPVCYGLDREALDQFRLSRGTQSVKQAGPRRVTDNALSPASVVVSSGNDSRGASGGLSRRTNRFQRDLSASHLSPGAASVFQTERRSGGLLSCSLSLGSGLFLCRVPGGVARPELAGLRQQQDALSCVPDDRQNRHL